MYWPTFRSAPLLYLFYLPYCSPQKEIGRALRGEHARFYSCFAGRVSLERQHQLHLQNTWRRNRPRALAKRRVVDIEIGSSC